MTSLDTRDPAIKLFGKTIQLPANVEVEGVVRVDEQQLGKDDDLEGVEASSMDQVEQESDEEDPSNMQLEADPSTADDVQRTAGTVPSESATADNESPKTPSPEKETTSDAVKPQDEEQSEAANNGGKEKPALKKPDKILPCPRCNSLDTKFCYYNNYNVNQPRHFCKNCQRYWTAGGTMRNVPVGAGRRKNKNSGSHYRHLTLSDRSSDVHSEVMAAHRLPLKPNGTVLSFSPDAPLCESMSSVLNLAEKGMIKGCYGGGFVVQEEQSRGDHQSGNSCVSASTNSSEDGNGVNLRDQTTAVAAGGCYPGFAQIPCFPPAAWAYPWNPAQWRAPMHPPSTPPFCSTTFPMPFFPAAAAYWGCAAPPPTAWAGVPWISPPSPTASCVTGSNSPTLGKHSREETNAAPNSDQTDQPEKNGGGSEKCLWIPKTLRIDDPGDAAKSSIWSTLGINKEKYDGRSSGTGLFKAFPSDDSSQKSVGPSQVLHANPAALSRSLTFHETS